MRAGTHAPSGSPEESRRSHRPLQWLRTALVYTPGLGAPLCTHLPKVFPEPSVHLVLDRKGCAPSTADRWLQSSAAGAELRGRALDCRARPPGAVWARGWPPPCSSSALGRAGALSLGHPQAGAKARSAPHCPRCCCLQGRGGHRPVAWPPPVCAFFSRCPPGGWPRGGTRAGAAGGTLRP